MIYGYARCSLSETRQDVSRQIRELKNLGCDLIISEYESGAKEDRAELLGLLDKLVENDTIICLELSRITRSTKQLCDIIQVAKTKKVKLIIGNFIVDCRGEIDPMTLGMLQMMGVFAELERNMIRARVMSGLANAKAKGVKIGRPSTKLEDLPSIYLRYYPKFKGNEINVTEFARLTGLSRQSIYKYNNLLEGNR